MSAGTRSEGPTPTPEQQAVLALALAHRGQQRLLGKQPGLDGNGYRLFAHIVHPEMKKPASAGFFVATT